MQTIGFVGLGNMGGNMAARYLEHGYTVHGSARSPDGTEWLVEKGLRWEDTPREIAQAADVVMTSLPNDEVVNAVAGGENGLVAGLGEGKVWAELSTISPDASRALSASVRDGGGGAQVLDTPVSGSVPQVKSGTLTIMAGGDAGAFALIEPVLAVIGTPVHVGENGQGLVLKLAVNISLAVQMLAFSEGLLLAARDGVEPHLAADVMTQSAIGSPMLKARVPLVLDRPEETWFDVSLMHKDIRLALDTARGENLALPSARVADEVLGEAGDLGYEHRDIASLYEVLDRINH